MNRRSVIVCTAVAVLLLAGIGYLFCSLFFGGSGKDADAGRIDGGAVKAVPSDAIFLLETGSFSEILEMTDDGSALGRLAGCIPVVSHEWEAVLSMHYSSKNAVSPLLVLSVPEKVDAASFLSEILENCGGVIEKRYGQVAVHKSAVPDASFAVYGNYLIASPSIVIVESSVRHLENGMSASDDPLYSSLSGVPSGDGVLHVNFSNLGKLFSGMAGRKYVKNAAFFQSFADWGTFGVSASGTQAVFDGGVKSVRTGEKYSDVLLTQRGRKPEIYSVAPYNASYVLSLPLPSCSEYLQAYRAYLAANGRKKDYDYINAVKGGRNGKDGISTQEFVMSLEPEEIGVFAYEQDGLKKILAVKTRKRSVLGNYCDTALCDYLFEGYIPAVFGELFRPSTEDKYIAAGDWILIGGGKELLRIRQQMADGSFFPMKEYLEQTPASGELRELSCMSLLVNTCRYSDTLSGFLRSPYSSVAGRLCGGRNFGFAAVNTYRSGDMLGMKVTVYSEDLKAQPVHKSSGKQDAPAAVENIMVEIPEGPFPVRNFIDGSTNYLEQLDNYDLRLLNSRKRPVWTVGFDLPLCGTVRQIDYLKNNKLQMLFGAGNKIYLLDRLGRKVGKFPIEVDGGDILLGPDVYDFDGNRNYSLMILHKDNKLSMYNIDGTRPEAWNDIILSEPVVALPELLRMDCGDYWIVRTSYQTLLYSRDGTVCADFTKKRRLRQDTSVEPVSSHEVAVINGEGRQMVLDLKNGSFRKR